ncbi:MAG TPA: 2-amino-4-hydroxy-6-hydroxymethyldihydropteridine diphosphokinase, partial [Pseudolysinimonas sp.]
LPHPRAHQRDFVLRPWLEVDPDAVLPGHGRVADLLAALDAAGHPETGS